MDETGAFDKHDWSGPASAWFEAGNGFFLFFFFLLASPSWRGFFVSVAGQAPEVGLRGARTEAARGVALS